jgi:hypothetical protein
MVAWEIVQGKLCGARRFPAHLDETIAKGGAVSQVGPCQVTVERCRVKLGENVHLGDPAVDAVAHWHIDQAIGTSDWNLVKSDQKSFKRYTNDGIQGDNAGETSAVSRSLFQGG